MLSWRFIKWVVLANVFALPVAWYVMSRWLKNFAYRIHIETSIFLLASGLAPLIVLATVAYRAFRAATANPADSLRYE
jgi:putative ABC transport system permease protein